METMDAIEIELVPRRDDTSFVVQNGVFICPNEECENDIPLEYVRWNDYPIRVDGYTCPVCDSSVEFRPYYDIDNDAV